MPTNPTEHFEAASTLAIVVSSNEPLLFLSADLKVIAASASFCRAFDIDPATIPARPLSEIGRGEWAMPKLASLLRATASGSARIEAYEIDLVRPNQKNRQLVVNAHALDDGDNTEHVRLLDVSVSLGLIVTELVINALKHAFPEEMTGMITVDYRSSGSDWTLSVTDNGVGMPTASEAPKAGLGTGIVLGTREEPGRRDCVE